MISPHFSLPFRFQTAQAGFACNEQDTLGDVSDCIEAALRFTRGTRLDEPTFGITDPTFDQIPVSIDRIQAEVLEHEPRAQLLIETTEIDFDAMFQRIAVRVSPKEDV